LKKPRKRERKQLLRWKYSESIIIPTYIEISLFSGLYRSIETRWWRTPRGMGMNHTHGYVWSTVLPFSLVFLVMLQYHCHKRTHPHRMKIGRNSRVQIDFQEGDWADVHARSSHRGWRWPLSSADGCVWRLISGWREIRWQTRR